MSLVMNTNIVAINAARNLGAIYSRLSNSTQSLSTGLRIKSAADDPVNLAVRELMRTDIASLDQALRNVSDGVSMVQTAEGAMAVIDEKLIRMKELAEQAATGSFTTVQRELINSEYQTMAREIDRIASATDFNGVNLLDGSLSMLHKGQGLKIHFGIGNQAGEDYYFLALDDVRATTNTGLRVGGDAKADIHLQSADQGTTGLEEDLFADPSGAGDFIYYYNYQGDEDLSPAALEQPSYLAGIYHQASGATLDSLIRDINRGTASRIEVNFAIDQKSALGIVDAGDHLNVCLGDEIYQFGSGAASSAAVFGRAIDGYIDVNVDRGGAISSALTAEVNGNAASKFFGIYDAASQKATFFFKEGGNNDHEVGCDFGDVVQAEENVSWTNVETGQKDGSQALFSLGGRTWARAGYQLNDGRYSLSLTGAQVGQGYDLVVGDASATYQGQTASGLGAESFTQVRNAADGRWDGAEIRTQSAAQLALEQVQMAMIKTNQVNADLGTLQNRLENTAEHLSLKKSNIAVAESKISDVDVAVAMTTFTRDDILAQVSTAMLAQSNSFAELALSLIY